MQAICSLPSTTKQSFPIHCNQMQRQALFVRPVMCILCRPRMLNTCGQVSCVENFCQLQAPLHGITNILHLLQQNMTII